MEKFTKLTGIAAPMPLVNIDTDMIIPKQFLKTIHRSGLGKNLFDEMRYTADGSENPEFVLNKPAWREAQIIVAGDNFGCGSSREHAPWALTDLGLRAIVSSEIADIFRGNSGKAGLVAAQVEQPDVELLWKRLEENPGLEVTVSLVDKTVTAGDLVVPLAIDDYTRWRLMEGLDDIGLTLREVEAISEYESARPAFKPRTLAD